MKMEKNLNKNRAASAVFKYQCHCAFGTLLISMHGESSAFSGKIAILWELVQGQVFKDWPQFLPVDQDQA